MPSHPHTLALYQVSVRWVRCLPLTSFRFHLAIDTLVSLAVRFPLPGFVRDLHPLDDTHAGQTKQWRLHHAMSNAISTVNYSVACLQPILSHEHLHCAAGNFHNVESRSHSDSCCACHHGVCHATSACIIHRSHCAIGCCNFY